MKPKHKLVFILLMSFLMINAYANVTTLGTASKMRNNVVAQAGQTGTNMSAPGANMSAPGANMSAPGANMNKPGANMSTPGANLNTPGAISNNPATNSNTLNGINPSQSNTPIQNPNMPTRT